MLSDVRMVPHPLPREGKSLRSLWLAVTGPARLRRSLLAQVVVLALAACGGGTHHSTRTSSSTSTSSTSSVAPIAVLNDPINRDQQLLLPFGARSHWLQPWRAYLDTVPATTLRDAIGINIDNTVQPFEVPALARLLHTSGFTRARYEIGWGDVDYEDPSRLVNEAGVRTVLKALHRNGIRPLILLNANEGIPTATRFFTATVTEPAVAGARTLTLSPSSVEEVKPGLTGLNSLTGAYKAAATLFTSVTGDVVTLAAPLPRALTPGPYQAATLKYAPFGPPRLPDGRINPEFATTMAGWLQYVKVVTHLVKRVLGGDNFDVEVWNELSFGSDFLNLATYVQPPPAGSGDVAAAIIAQTTALLRNPANGASGVGIGDGFENEQPFGSGATVAAGVTAIDKHPYAPLRRFPAAAATDAPGMPPLNAFGHAAGKAPDNPRTQPWIDDFVPTYTAFFPEYWLTGIQTETAIRDLSPYTTTIYGEPHGRNTHPPGGHSPTMWVTEFNMDPTGTGMPPAAIEHMQAKAVLRFLSSWVNKGVTAVDFYAAKMAPLALVNRSFFAAVDASHGAYPGNAGAGPTMPAIQRLVAALAGTQSLGKTRQLTLLQIADYSGHAQFHGNGTAALPPLYDRDVIGFFPFQVNADKFVIPTFVMTRDLSEIYRSSIRGPTRYDLPDERFGLTIGGLSSTDHVTARATDPLTGKSEPVQVTARSSHSVTVELALSDSPRLLVLDDPS